MKLSIHSKAIIVEIVCYLHVLLFVYAGVSKLLDYENFKVQLGQSPMLNVHSGWIAWFIPSSELVMAILLLIPSTKLLGIFASYFLMLLFSAYIFATLNFSDYVPCSCGGILEEMTWHQHLIFNLIFCALALIAIFFYNASAHNFAIKFRSTILLQLGLSSGAILAVVILSQNQSRISNDDSFSRIFKQHLYVKIAEKKLKYRGYYFAGSDNDKIYLGNLDSPLSVLEVDSILSTVHDYNIKLDNYDLPFRSVNLRISPPYFYLTDGTIPAIYKGELTDWSATRSNGFNSRFSAIEVADSNTIFFRSKSTKTRETILGRFRRKSGNWEITNVDDLLQKQIDGVFDSDGMMHFNKERNMLVYLYYYRNQYVVADNNLNLLFRAHTIDTNTQAKIKVSSLQSGQRKLSAPPQIVNNYSSTARNLLFINSNLRTSIETAKDGKESEVVDVYNLDTQKYEHSFLIYKGTSKKVQGMFATPTRIYFLIDDLLVAYRYATPGASL